MAIKTDDSKMNATKAFINTWLKDNTVYCASCGQDFNGTGCCNEPHLTNRQKRVAEFIQANKENNELLFNEFGASKSKNMRHAVSMPTELLRDIERYFKTQYGEKFLSEKKELYNFMRAFPQFSVARRI